MGVDPSSTYIAAGSGSFAAEAASRVVSLSPKSWLPGPHLDVEVGRRARCGRRFGLGFIAAKQVRGDTGSLNPFVGLPDIIPSEKVAQGLKMSNFRYALKMNSKEGKQNVETKGTAAFEVEIPGTKYKVGPQHEVEVTFVEGGGIKVYDEFDFGINVSGHHRVASLLQP